MPNSTPLNPLPAGDPLCSDRGDRWFAEEVRPHEPALRAYLHRKFPQFAEVDDVVQESYLKAFLAWQKGRLTSVRGFLFTVAGNITVSLFRRRRLIAPLPVSEFPDLRVVDDDADTVESICSGEELELIAGAIATLPDRCRQVAVRRILQGQDSRTIARELGMSEPTVRVQLARAMKKCCRYLQDRGFPPANTHETRT